MDKLAACRAKGTEASRESSRSREVDRKFWIKRLQETPEWMRQHCIEQRPFFNKKARGE